MRCLDPDLLPGNKVVRNIRCATQRPSWTGAKNTRIPKTCVRIHDDGNVVSMMHDDRKARARTVHAGKGLRDFTNPRNVERDSDAADGRKAVVTAIAQRTKDIKYADLAWTVRISGVVLRPRAHGIEHRSTPVCDISSASDRR